MRLFIATVFCCCVVHQPGSVNAWPYSENGVPKYWFPERYSNGQFNMDLIAKDCEEMGWIDHACTTDARAILYCDRDDRVSVRRCEAGFVCGKCEVDVFDEGQCRCVRDVVRPRFPATGSITWTGSITYHMTTYPIKGEMRLNAAGHCLLKTVDYTGWSEISRAVKRTSTSVYVPNVPKEGLFTRCSNVLHGTNYDYDNVCKKGVMRDDRTKDLTWLWEYFSTDKDPKQYELLKDEGDLQRWGDSHDYSIMAMNGVTDSKDWWMKVKVLKTDGVAVPSEFYMTENRDFKLAQL